jgi:O-antigen ligase
MSEASPLVVKRKIGTAEIVIVIGMALAVPAAVWSSLPLSLTAAGVLGIVAVMMPALTVPLILTAVIALMPFAGDLVREAAGTGKTIGVGVSDLLLAASLPGWLRLAWQHRRRMRLALPQLARWYVVWVLGFLVVCGISFGWNRHAMSGLLSYAAGGMRVVQMLCLVPLVFAAVSWTEERLRGLWTSLLCTSCVIMAAAIVHYLAGAGGHPIFGVHKNGIGLSVALGALVALAIFWSKEPAQLAPILPVRCALFLGMPALAFASSRIGVICFLCGMLALSLHYRKVILPLILFAVLVGSLWIAGRIKPPHARGAEMTVSLSEVSVQERMDQYRRSWARFRQNPLLGDGLRARKDIEPHNLEILLLAETGLLGLAAFGGVLCSHAALFRHALVRLRDRGGAILGSVWALAACSVALLVHAQADPFWRKGPLFLMGASVGILCSLLRELPDHTVQVETERA